MNYSHLLADDPAGQIRSDLTLLNLTSEPIHRDLSKYDTDLPALNVVVQSLRHYDKDFRHVGWNLHHYQTIHHNIRVLETQMATSFLRGPAFFKVYRPALSHVEKCEELTQHIIRILRSNPELQETIRPDEPPMPLLEAFPASTITTI